jgi:hypothetical protein
MESGDGGCIPSTSTRGTGVVELVRGALGTVELVGGVEKDGLEVELFTGAGGDCFSSEL